MLNIESLDLIKRAAEWSDQPDDAGGEDRGENSARGDDWED